MKADEETGAARGVVTACACDADSPIEDCAANCRCADVWKWLNRSATRSAALATTVAADPPTVGSVLTFDPKTLFPASTPSPTTKSVTSFDGISSSNQGLLRTLQTKPPWASSDP